NYHSIYFTSVEHLTVLYRGILVLKNNLDTQKNSGHRLSLFRSLILLLYVVLEFVIATNHDAPPTTPKIVITILAVLQPPLTSTIPATANEPIAIPNF